MLRVVVSFTMAVAPALILLGYYLRQDRARPEPKGAVLRVFLMGVVATLAAVVLEMLVSSFQGLFAASPFLFIAFRAFIVAGLVEEWLKYQVVIRFAYRTAAFDEVMDGIVYAVVASLGFACFENILYVLGGTLWTALIRAVTAVPLHATASGLMGYYVGRARFARSQEEEMALRRRGLWTAVLIHGGYDFLLFGIPLFGPVPAFGVIPLILGAFFALRRKIRMAIDEDRSSGHLGPGPFGLNS